MSTPDRAVTTPPLDVAGITFDFGNTLVRVDREGLRAVVVATAAALVARGVVADEAAFLRAWVAERDRQFRIQVPHLREVYLAERVLHVLAALRGATVPATDADAWDDAAARELADPADIAFAVETYSSGFVATMAALPEADATLRGAHAAGYRLGILSNWPLARTIDRYVDVAGWSDLLAAVIVSQRVGVIKPHPAIFGVAAEALGLAPDRLLHVGDDWAADVVGAKRAGWRVAYLRGHQRDTPLPTSTRDSSATPDVELDSLSELLPRLGAGALTT